jgi:diaminopimelate decarboxylase
MTTRELGGVRLDRVLPALRRLEPDARACWLYDLDAIAGRAARFLAAMSSIDRMLAAFALKANALPDVLETMRAQGLGGEAGSLGELEMASAAGFGAERRVSNGNGRTPEEAAWIARHGVHSVNADSIDELDRLEAAAAREDATVRVALRVNPAIDTPGHRYVATGHDEAKFGVGTQDALEAWSARARWPHLTLDGVHVHVGSQLVDATPVARALEAALELADASARRGAPLGLLNLGGGFGIDYDGVGREFPLEAYGARVAERLRGRGVACVFEPGRWLVGPCGVLLAEVVAVKRRDGHRFVVLAAGLNDLLRPALYGARHRIVPVVPRAGAPEPATVVGPVCESADVFGDDIALPPLEPGDVVAVLDAGAYGAVMSSNYNGRCRLAELVVRGGRLSRARAGETLADLDARRRADPLAI